MIKSSSPKIAIAAIFHQHMGYKADEMCMTDRSALNAIPSNDPFIETIRSNIETLKCFEGQHDEFLAALRFFGPKAASRLGAILSGELELARISSLQEAFIKMGDPNLKQKEIKYIRLRSDLIELLNPQFFIHYPIAQRVRSKLDMADPDPLALEDSGDGIELDLALTYYSNLAPKRFCSSLFNAATYGIEQNHNPATQARAAMLLLLACRWLPDNGVAPHDEDANPKVMGMIGQAIKNNPALSGALKELRCRLYEMKEQQAIANPIQFANAIYDELFKSKVAQALNEGPI